MKLKRPVYFSCPSDLSLQSYCPLHYFLFHYIVSQWNLVNKISQESQGHGIWITDCV